MLTGAIYFLGSIAIALLFAMAWKPHAFGWWLIGIGILFLTHAGITIVIIWANNNVVPAGVNAWQLFATIPVGIILMAIGLVIVCVRSCVGRAFTRQRRYE